MLNDPADAGNDSVKSIDENTKVGSLAQAGVIEVSDEIQKRKRTEQSSSKDPLDNGGEDVRGSKKSRLDAGFTGARPQDSRTV